MNYFEYPNSKIQDYDPDKVYFQLPQDVQEEGIIKHIDSYRIQNTKLIISYFLFFATCGILYLFTRQSIAFKIKLQLIKCQSSQAKFMRIVSKDDQITLVRLETKSMKFNDKPQQDYLIFSYRLYTYYYDSIQNCFLPIQFAVNLLTNNEIYQQHGFGIQSQDKFKDLVSIYGQNNTEIPDKSTIKILIDEVLSPFYIFQIFSIILWILEPYYYYAGIIFFTSALSCIVTLIETKNNYKKLREMSFFETDVFVYRGISQYIKLEGGFIIDREISNYKQKVSSLDLVPGDIIEIPDGQILPCDVILLNGSSVMNESMLTGESIPIIKPALPFSNSKYNPNEDGKQSTLFAGTKCIETRYHLKGSVPILGLVSSTSFNTMKGQLVRSILYQKQNSFSFYVDSLKFILVLALISILGFFFSLPFLIRGYNLHIIELRDLILNSLDLVTITVPPALPTCLSIGISFAISRLKKQKIYCISPPKVNISGKVTIMCFDKTGTLTEEGLDMYGLKSVNYQGPNKINFAKLEEETYRLGMGKDLKLNGKVEQEHIYGEENPFSLIGDPDLILKECMASCHGVTIIKGELIGDPLEVKMFEATEWDLIEQNLSEYSEPVLAVVKSTNRNLVEEQKIKQQFNQNNQSHTKLGIVKRFEFSSKLQRMSTIVKNLDFNTNFYKLYVKGSPEKIFELSNPSTIPQNFHEVLDFYARKGFRVLAFGIKVLKMNQFQIQQLERDEVENNLTFTGLLIMENKLKPITTSIIEELQEANIRTIMVTGDNALTAISVGRQCKILDEKKRVYFGDLSDDPTQKDKIIWKDFENGQKQLKEDNLEPENGVIEYKEHQILEIQEEKLIIQKAQQLESVDRRISLMQQNQMNKSKKRNQTQLVVQSSKIYRQRAKTQMSQQNNQQALTEQEELKSQPNIKQQNQQSIIIQYSSDSNQIYNSDKQNQSSGLQEQQEIAALNDDIQDLVPWNNSEESYTLAITGRAFSAIINQSNQNNEKAQLLRTMLLKTQIFARMRPEEKAQLLQQLQELPWKPTCGMCGDGANDCGALKTADMGISLSDAEASIAAPFTSKTQDISCVVQLLKEGRAALVTSFSCFKFMALYSMIQFFTTTILYTVNSLPGDMQFLYWDLVIIIPLAFLMGLTDSYPTLSKQVPGSSLISFPVLCSVIGMTFLNGGFQVIMFFILRAQGWYMSVYDSHSYIGDFDDPDSRKSCYESTVLFLFSNFQYISTCVAFSIGKPFKREFYTNKWFTISLFLILICSLYILLLHDSFTTSFLNIFEQVKQKNAEPISKMPYSFLLVILGVACASFIVNILYEKYVVVKLAIMFKNRKDEKRSKEILVPIQKFQS
ncbi:E1-E2 ATPase family protein (macronuclear) [Tetrahymena thermophila SB210]|uniref:E1-E2 ATPase family protein n=1 Tax=Tetrahymena thermophila (strain SB210) TaxID=312017 RepID=Q23QV7_TETTS|nr:E1-E2 ATPase family protein [Tetrahymena thermophila SB210]EAR98781.2 E1-E2 ATPase family protein [Tetrahymena thermophila SB210]|eukprot:XP_001019026.2 E1-E2 ATPase family protein [Tetrahymena thermophila SB210]